MTDQQLIQLTEEYGAPIYVYDTAIMQSQYERLTKAFAHSPMKVKYACKALSNINVLKFFHSLGSGLDTVSIQEVRLGLLAGYDPKDIIFTPNGVAMDELREAVRLGVHINIDNIGILEQFGHE